MSLWYAPLLGVVQGLTEFLPVSSSGHLALAQMLIPGFQQPGVVFDAALHLGTAAAVVYFERRQIAEWIGSSSGRRLLAMLLAATAATALIAIPLRPIAVAAFERALWVGVCLVITGCVVAATRGAAGGHSDEESTGWRQAIIVGLAQGAAIFPGISRSGFTIAAGLGVGLDRAWAARFSFLLSVPAIVGVSIAEMVGNRHGLLASGAGFWIACAVGLAAAALSGYLALRIVIKTVSSQTFHRFAWYCLPLGGLVLGLSLGIG
jgi:undecaprenyl-diphosphatase